MNMRIMRRSSSSSIATGPCLRSHRAAATICRIRYSSRAIRTYRPTPRLSAISSTRSISMEIAEIITTATARVTAVVLAGGRSESTQISGHIREVPRHGAWVAVPRKSIWLQRCAALARHERFGVDAHMQTIVMSQRRSTLKTRSPLPCQRSRTTRRRHARGRPDVMSGAPFKHPSLMRSRCRHILLSHCQSSVWQVRCCDRRNVI